MQQTQFQLIRVIRKIRLFRGLGVESIKKLLPFCRLVSYKEGENIYEIGDISREMLILLKGRLEVSDQSGEILATIQPGASVGEMGVFTGEPRSANVIARGEISGLIIGKNDLQKLMTIDTDINNKILHNLVAVLSERLVQANRLNNRHTETIAKMDDQLVRHTGLNSGELEEQGL